MNGDDAIGLVRINPYKLIDIFGRIGEQPATAWSDVSPYIGTTGKWWTKDHSMQRKPGIKVGVMSNPGSFNPKLEWDSLPRDNWTKLNGHDCDCKPVGVNENAKAVYLKVFPNPSNSSEIAFVSDNIIKEVKIYNTVGQVVYVSSSNDKTVVLRNLNLTSGVYYATVKNSIGTKTEKIIIQ